MRRMTIVLLLGCVASLAAAGDRLRIVATTSDLAAIARAVAGPEADVTALCTGQEDPHFLQPKPAVIMASRKADLWIRVGLDLEVGWEGPVLDGTRNPAIRPGQPGHLDASETIDKLDVPEGPVSRDQGDVHPHGNPHYWLDPFNGRLIAAAVAERLVRLRPDQADAFRENARRFQRGLDMRMFGSNLVERAGADALWRWSREGNLATNLVERGWAGLEAGWSARLRPLRGTRAVTYHRSWLYFARRFGLEVIGEIEPKPGVPPTAAHLAELAEAITRNSARILLQETFYSRRAADRLAEQTGARVVVAPNMVGGAPEASDYPALFDLLADRLARAVEPAP